MRTLFVVLITGLLLASCGSFQRMHYRDLRKVPATMLQFTARGFTDINASDSVLKLADTLPADIVRQSFMIASVQDKQEQVLVVHSSPGKQNYTRVSGRKEKQPVHHISFPIRRDLSPGMAIILIFIGFLILGYCVLLLPYLALELGWIVILELLFTYSAVNMILRGIAILRNRLRPRDNYKEE